MCNFCFLLCVCIFPVRYNTRNMFSFSGRKVFYLVHVKNKQHSYIDGGNSIWSILYKGQHFNICHSSKYICPLTQQSWVAQMVRSLPAMQEIRVWSLGQEDSWRREWLPTPVFLTWKFHGQRSLAGYSCKESDTTKWLTLFRFSAILQLHFIL